nr:response regulator [Nocardia australiensis]
MTSAFGVLIVEDDVVISRVYAKLIDAMPSFTVLGTARSAASGSSAAAALDPHLLLLDYGLPGGVSGIDLLRQVRMSARQAEVIAITAHSSTDLVRESMRLGVLDYLVKPFSEERLRQALNKFVTIATCSRTSTLPQQDVDALRESSAPAKQWIPRELSEKRLSLVRKVFREENGVQSAEDIADLIDSSRVTARRYLEFLVSLRELEVTVDSEKPGRPRKLYSRRPPQNSQPGRRQG